MKHFINLLPQKALPFGNAFLPFTWIFYFHNKLPSCSACRLAGRMAILTMEVGDFHSKLPSCLTSRATGRMAILTMEVGDFHSKPPSCPACRLAGRMAILTMEAGSFHILLQNK